MDLLFQERGVLSVILLNSILIDGNYTRMLHSLVVPIGSLTILLKAAINSKFSYDFARMCYVDNHITGQYHIVWGFLTKSAQCHHSSYVSALAVFAAQCGRAANTVGSLSVSLS